MITFKIIPFYPNKKKKQGSQKVIKQALADTVLCTFLTVISKDCSKKLAAEYQKRSHGPRSLKGIDTQFYDGSK
jgi:hypothetical protein